ncbi:twin-arginine translocase subunit TatC [uncultured Bacteroides sp.]|uniref:twin-arginine translocase subunit TatC n=1 Tax=uncultured Bacteroides sp. TaxID=162156 RepID=UPI0027D99651|nr:twin-arginine translocase subunit TatC [uncultured Bacteroides sp.]
MNDEPLTFGGHLEALRRMLFRILGVVAIVSLFIFLIKEIVWDILLAPSECDFVTYRAIERLMQDFGFNFHFDKYEVQLIATDLSSQFMTHITTSIYLSLLVASPYILYELFRFTLPALYDNERKYSVYVVIITYTLFIVGVLMSYFIIFPISFRFLGTYSVAEKVNSMITLSSYISTYISLTLVMGVVFQLPVIIFILAKMRIVDFQILSRYRKYALFTITAISAIITPPDIMTCILVTVPLYFLYECSIWIAKKVNVM